MYINNLNYFSNWLVTSFNIKIDNKGYESDLEDELIEMHVDLEVKTSPNIEFCSNIITATKPPVIAATEPFLPVTKVLKISNEYQ